MQRIPRFWGIHAEPTMVWKIFLGLLPFVLMIGTYMIASHYRLQDNPQDKLLPSISKMSDSMKRMAFEKDKRKGEYLLWKDTGDSLQRLYYGVGSAAAVGMLLGINMGVFPGFRALFLPFIKFLSIIPPLAILPILFISFGVDELGKCMLIFIGTLFMITRDIYAAIGTTIHKEQITKALTLGASQFQLAYRIVLPQIMPRLISTLRICFGAAWLFLLASEGLASTSGLGYRIYLVRRYLAMDVIIPYVAWITLIGYTHDLILFKLNEWKYSWYSQKG